MDGVKKLSGISNHSVYGLPGFAKQKVLVDPATRTEAMVFLDDAYFFTSE